MLEMEQQVDEDITFKLPLPQHYQNQQSDSMAQQATTAESEIPAMVSRGRDQLEGEPIASLEAIYIGEM